MKALLFTVTNDLNYDQRMIRICTTLQVAGYNVLLVGRQYKSSPPLQNQPFAQKRLSCFFKQGKLFYAEYNLRLLLYGLLKKFDLICAIDLDTIVPCYLLSVLKRRKRVYDAHELFCEMKEVKTRPAVFKIWKWIECNYMPRFQQGYTVNAPIREIFYNDYGVQYSVVRNMPVLQTLQPTQPEPSNETYIIYQGAVNEGRSFETLIPAFQWIDVPLWIFGDGNFYNEAVRLTQQHGLQHKVVFKGKQNPETLRQATHNAVLGLTLFENSGLSNYYSLANRFFDYIHAGIPQVCVDYPVYHALNAEHEVAVLISDLSPASIAKTINNLLQNKEHLKRLRQNCLTARNTWNWQAEEKVLLSFYETLFARGA